MRPLCVAFGLLTISCLFSCKKEYTCVCTIIMKDSTITQEWNLGKLKQKDAEAGCRAGEMPMSCHLK